VWYCLVTCLTNIKDKTCCGHIIQGQSWDMSLCSHKTQVFTRFLHLFQPIQHLLEAEILPRLSQIPFVQLGDLGFVTCPGRRNEERKCDSGTQDSGLCPLVCIQSLHPALSQISFLFFCFCFVCFLYWPFLFIKVIDAG
jgi:hypothetical protein